MRISCKGPLNDALYVYCYLKNQFYVFQTSPVVVYPSDVSIEYVIAPVSLTESVFMFHYLKNDSKYRQKHHWQRRLEVILQETARNHFWEAGMLLQSYMLETV